MRKERGGKTTITDYVVPLAALEAAAGVEAFPDLLDDRKRALIPACDSRVLANGVPLLPSPAAATPPKRKDRSLSHLCECDQIDCGVLLRTVRASPKPGSRKGATQAFSNGRLAT
eukprot:FR741916.1.p1 GENE.FR741916.1~~FR741916.1.p1  ORF type:complete len:135 (+),score=1.64 FR741916.1:61-405(+)